MCMSRTPARRMKCATLVLLSILSTSIAMADVPEVERPEVRHLLEYLRTSGCELERNGARHSGPDAYLHVKRKYEYFRSEITSTETFIEYAATRSTMSGEYYRVHCGDGPPIRTRDWLLEELWRIRG